MKKLMILISVLLTCTLVAGALAESDATSARLCFDANPTTGYTWTAFVLSGDAVAVSEGVYVSGDTTGTLAGAGGQTTFTLTAVKPGVSLVQFLYARSWENDFAQRLLYHVYVDETLNITCEEVTESGVIEGTVIAVNAEVMTALISTENLGDVLALFSFDDALPALDEHVIIYTDGTMTMSLPAIVNVHAWETVAPEQARGPQQLTFGALTGFDAFAAIISDDNPVVSAYYEDGTEMHAHFTTEDPDEVKAMLDAVSQLEIASVTDEMITDHYPLLRLTAAGGEEWSVGFTGRNLSKGQDDYTLDGADTLWKLLSRLTEKYADAE